MGTDDYILDGYNMFMNPGLLRSQFMFGASPQTYSDYLNSIHTDGVNPGYLYGNSGMTYQYTADGQEPIFNVPYSNSGYGDGFYRSYGYNFSGNYSNSYMHSYGQPAADGGQTDNAQNGNGTIKPYMGGTFGTYLSGGGKDGNISATGLSPLNELPDNFVLTARLTPEDVGDNAKGYGYAITYSGGVRYYDPKGKEISESDFKTAVGDDYSKYETAISSSVTSLKGEGKLKS